MATSELSEPPRFLHHVPMAGPSHLGKRLRAPSPNLLRRRVRDLTPCILDLVEGTSAGIAPDLGASAATGPVEGSGSIRPESNAVAGVFGPQSEEEDRSVLFSDQRPIAILTDPPLVTVEYVEGDERAGVDEAFEDTGGGNQQFDVEGDHREDYDEEGDGDGDGGADDQFEESHEAKDFYDEREDTAETPDWLIEDAQGGSRSAAKPDRMTRVLEGDSTGRNVPYEVLLEAAEADGDASSYHSGDTDEYEMDYRPVLDRPAVKRDCDTMHKLHSFWDAETGCLRYKVTDRLGEGTFSAVYLARDVLHTRYDNEFWTGSVPEDGDAEEPEEEETVRVAIKKVTVTSSPSRIENELAILESLRGSRHLSKLITAFRQDDQIFIVLSYHSSDDFRHFYRHMDVNHIREYMRCLLRALKDTHARGIIHRDVKPGNFLFDYETNEGTLCDFGLAERYVPPRKPTCQHSPATHKYYGGDRTRTSETSVVEQAVYDARKRAKLGEGRIGFLSDDKRPSIKPNRAGTRGFRAPEVLLKCPDQNFSIDIWSAGIMLLSLLVHRFPVFSSNDDIEALMELAALFGRSAMERCAVLHNRTIISNVPTIDDESHGTLTDICLRLNPRLYEPPMLNPTPQEAREHIEGMDLALELLQGLVRMDCTTRYSANRALRHPFFHPCADPKTGPWKEDLEEPRSLAYDEGKCGELHGVLDGKHKAWFGDRLIDMQFGQGRATAKDDFCPEHEHWQMRNGQNVLLCSLGFGADERGDSVDSPQSPERTGEAMRPPMTTKDLNLLEGGRYDKRLKQ